MPAVVVGDLNASQFHVYGVHEALKGAGYVEPLGIQRASHGVGDDTVEKRINTHINSFNNFGSRPIIQVGPQMNGTFIDYIFTTPMRVLEYETVVDLDASGRFRGGPPSDHNMLRAVVGLPVAATRSQSSLVLGSNANSASTARSAAWPSSAWLNRVVQASYRSA